MSKNNFLQDAIADAKVIRETALLNAKTVLEETLTPKIKRMLSNKLNEMEEYDEFSSNDELEEDMDLDSILRELEDDTLNENEDELDEAKDKDKDETKDKKEDKPKDDKSDKKPSTPKKEKEDKDEDDDKISDMTVEELTSLIKDVVSQEMGAGDEMPMDDMGMEDGPESTPPSMDNMGMDNMAPSEDDDINIDELLSELDDIYDSENKSEAINETKRKLNKQTKQLQEAYKVIKTLKGEINEINLLNSKLLYVNKIFKAKNLNESQKLRVLSSFDKATNVKEVKLIFESLSSTLSNLINRQNNKTQIRENLGSASRAIGRNTKPNIVEVDSQLARMQKLAGIK